MVIYTLRKYLYCDWSKQALFPSKAVSLSSVVKLDFNSVSWKSAWILPTSFPVPLLFPFPGRGETLGTKSTCHCQIATSNPPYLGGHKIDIQYNSVDNRRPIKKNNCRPPQWIGKQLFWYLYCALILLLHASPLPSCITPSPLRAT